MDLFNSLSGPEIAVILGGVGYVAAYFAKKNIPRLVYLIASLAAILLIGIGAANMHRVHIIGLIVLLAGAVYFQALQFMREKIGDKRYTPLALVCVGIVGLGVILALFLPI